MPYNYRTLLTIMNQKFDFDDVVIVPAALSDIDSRSEIALEHLPLFVAPMDTVVDRNNVELFLNLGYQVCMPRQETVAPELQADVFMSYGLDEVITMLNDGLDFPPKVLIDVANGHMKKLYDAAKRIKTERPETVLMVGNIANPETYKLYCEIGVDFVRVGIGSGSRCTTSANIGIHYPMGSLINECYLIGITLPYKSKIVADGGMMKYSDLLKALSLGADYCMLGGILSKSIEACSDNYVLDGDVYNKISNENALIDFNKMPVYKLYRGMSTKEVQAKWGRTVLKTAEGISAYNKVEYTLAGWTENFIDYLKSNMSYCGNRNLKEHIGKVQYVHITQNAYLRFKK